MNEGGKIRELPSGELGRHTKPPADPHSLTGRDSIPMSLTLWRLLKALLIARTA